MAPEKFAAGLASVKGIMAGAATGEGSRTYHDAIYEPEYGSEGEEDCCRGRGLAGILCWFLSVIILIGLAASVILTVFFVLKSRNLMGTASTGDDLDLLYGFTGPTSQFDGTGFQGTDFGSSPTTPAAPPTSSSSTTRRQQGWDFLPTASAKRPQQEGQAISYESSESGHAVTMRTRRPATTTTFPPTRRPYVTPNRTSPSTAYTTTTTTARSTTTVQTTTTPTTTTESSMFKLFFDTVSNFNHEDREAEDSPKSSSKEDAARDEILSNESRDRRVDYASASTPLTSGSLEATELSHVLFSMPPSVQTSTTSSQRRRPSRLPPLTSFSSSTENLEEAERDSSERPVHKRHGSTESHERKHNESKDRHDHKGHESSQSHGHNGRDGNERLEHKGHESIQREDQKYYGSNERHDHNGHGSSETHDHKRQGSSESHDHKHNESNDHNDHKWHESSQSPIHEWHEVSESPVPPDTTTDHSITLAHKHREDLLARIIKNLAPKFRNKTEIFSSIERVTPPSNMRVRTKVRTPTMSPSTAATFAVVTPTSGEQRFVGSLNQAFEVVEGPVLHEQNLSSTTDNQFLDILVGSEDSKTLFTKETDAGIITSAILPPWYVNETHGTGNGTGLVDTSAEGSGQSQNFTTTATAAAETMNSSASTHHLHTTAQDMGQLFLNLFTNTETEGPGPGPKYSNSQVAKVTEPTRATTFKELLKELSPIFPTTSSSNPYQYVPTNGYGYYPEEPSNEDRSEEVDEMENAPSHVIDIAYDPKTRPEIVIEPGLPQEDYPYGDYLHEREPLSAGSEAQPQVVAPPRNIPHNYGLRRQVTTPQKEQEEPTGTSNGQASQLAVPALDVINAGQENQSAEKQAEAPEIKPEPDAAEEGTNYEDEYGEVEVPINPIPMRNSVDNNLIVERQPVRQLDTTLYRQSQVPSPSSPPESTTKKAVYEIYSVSYTTTPAPVPTTTPSVSPLHVRNETGFIAPEPINFHSNVYSFKPSVSSGGFLPAGGDSWRPVVYDSEEDAEPEQNGPGRFEHEPARVLNPSSIKPSYQYGGPLRGTPPSTQPAPHHYEPLSEESSWSSPPSRAPIQPSQPIPPPPSAAPPAHHHDNRLKFPPPHELQQQQIQDSQPQGSGIDRSKYLYRPAPPPIVMRRTPQQSMPYLPNRRKTAPTYPRPPPYLNPQQQKQIQQQQMLKQRLFQQHLARLRKRGNVQWPQEHPHAQQGNGIDNRMAQQFPPPHPNSNGRHG